MERACHGWPPNTYAIHGFLGAYTPSRRQNVFGEGFLLFLAVGLLIFFPLAPSFGADFVVLETIDGGSTEVVAGDQKLVSKKFSPASTIKMVVAWAGLETGIISSQTVFLCNDPFVKGAPRGLNLHQAIVLSSNAYFEKIARILGEARLDEMVRKSGFFDGGPHHRWLAKGGIESAAHGGSATISPLEEHQFILRLMRGELGSSERLRGELKNALEWPSPDLGVRLFGKTGSDGRVVWFNGFGEKNGLRKAVTVFFKGSSKVRHQTISGFYSRWGLTWDEKLLEKPGFFQQ